MKITKQPSGTALVDEEMKTLTAILVKMGYTVSIRRDKTGGTSQKIVVAEEEK